MVEIMSVDEILSRLRERERTFDYPRACDREFWGNIPASEKEKLVKHAEELQAAPITALRLKDYLKFFREGNRIDFETPYFRRRHALAAFVLAECAEYKGRFIDDVAEMLWQILSEPVWCLPAHQHLGDFPLPGSDDWVVDLFSAETARILTDVLQLLRPELEKEFLPLIERINHEVEVRVLIPAEKNIYWWHEGRNNWSVWCAFSLNAAAIEVFQDDPDRLAAFLAKYMEPIKNFFDLYPPDGGCNEGPSYWVVAVGMLLNALEVLQRRLGGFEAWFKEPKLLNMVEFIPRMNLCGKWFLGFSDAESFFPRMPRGLFLKYAAMVNSKAMAELAVSVPDGDDGKENLGNRNLGSFYTYVADLTANLAKGQKVTHNAIDFWPDLQIWIARHNPEAPEKGIVCALKGGHNRQSHNHMDLGHFSLWFDNNPVIIDVGRGTYDRTCFSGDRYTLWNLNSSGHNAARFDGMDQGLGREYYTMLENKQDTVVCDITHAFLAENGVKSYLRTVESSPAEKSVTLTDRAAFEGEKSFEINFYTPVEPEEVNKNSLRLGKLQFLCEGIEIAKCRKVDWADVKINELWGTLYEIKLQGKGAENALWKMKFVEDNAR